jgi:arylsulfatase A-like enzyme
MNMTLRADPNVIAVATSAGGDGQDSPRERSIKVPLAIRFPGILIGRNAPEILVSHVDLMPTLLGLGGAPVPQTVQGRNLAPLLTRHQGDVPASVYVQGGDWRAVVRGFDKIVFNTAEEVLGLYNLADDPQAETDLSKDPQQKLTRDGLMALAKVWMRRLNDGWDPSGARLR